MFRLSISDWTYQIKRCYMGRSIEPQSISGALLSCSNQFSHTARCVYLSQDTLGDVSDTAMRQGYRQLFRTLYQMYCTVPRPVGPECEVANTTWCSCQYQWMMISGRFQAHSYWITSANLRFWMLNSAGPELSSNIRTIVGHLEHISWWSLVRCERSCEARASRLQFILYLCINLYVARVLKWSERLTKVPQPFFLSFSTSSLLR